MYAQTCGCCLFPGIRYTEKSKRAISSSSVMTTSIGNASVLKNLFKAVMTKYPLLAFQGSNG